MSGSSGLTPRDLALRRAGVGSLQYQKTPWPVWVAIGLLVFIGIVRYGPSPLPPTEEEKLKAELESEYSKWPDSGIKTAPVVPNPAADTPPVQQPTTPRFTVEQQPPSDSIEQPLPECSVVFFHHLEKTAGTTVRSILQRNAQLGHYDFFSFINRFNKLQFQTVTHRLDTLISQGPSALKGLRLAVEIHIGGGGYEHFIKYTLPDLLLLRKKLRAAGCRCNLVTLLRHPLTAHMSWHHHFVNQRVPLCFWNSPFDCQARMSIALACHGGPAVHPLTTDHHTAISKMWALFDLVGVTEHFDEFIVMLADLVGLPSVAYRSQMATKKTTEARVLAQQWTRRSCADLNANPPDALIGYIRRRMDTSALAAEEKKRRKARDDSHGPAGMMDCAGYGPCDVPGVPKREQTQYRWYDADKCAQVTPHQVLTRLCARMETDEPLYNDARAKFDARMNAGGESLTSRVAKLRAAGVELSRRAEEQAALPIYKLERQSGAKLSRSYKSTSGGGDRPPAPWVVDEFQSWYKPHERARFSCANCSGDVVPEFDLVGCWPLWPQFGPDEMKFTCTRKWTIDPGMNHPKDFTRRGSTEPLPCWQTCWIPLGGGAKHCTAACPEAGQAEAAVTWRQRWDREMAQWLAEEGSEVATLRRVTQFIPPKPSMDFMWGVF